jgi:AcrR family transcriptional regulator
VTTAKPAVAAGGPRRVGRPRAAPSRQMGVGGREQILDAAGRMFSEQGYGAASTRKIAMAVGVKQASLYYHFDCKEDILAGLLTGTVEPSLEFAEKLARTEEPAHIQLYALTYFDVSLLCSARWNVGALYHLPELRADRFAPFRKHRQLLRAAYGRRIADGAREGIFQVASVESATSLVFALAESGIAMRSDDLEIQDNLPELTAASVLRLLMCDEKSLAAAAAACDRLQP